MPLLNTPCRTFLGEYQREYQSWTDAAWDAEKLFRSIIADTGVFFHLVTSRAKTPDSLRAKLRKKGYDRPETKATDLIGVRIITYYQDDVDKVVTRLKSEFKIDLRNSVDKRMSLNLYEFGYRSVHLIARLRTGRANSPEFKSLRKRCFEIQVRSILEHSWAEIEHEVIYKGGVAYPEPVKRRFAAIAGTLEMLDAQFLLLRDEWERLINLYERRYAEDRDLAKRFDGARLAAFCAARFPKGLSWLKAKNQGNPFPPGIEATCVEALHAIGVRTPNALLRLMQRRKFKRGLRDFASANGIGPEEVSHLALVVLAVFVEDPSVLLEHFPEMLYDPALANIIRAKV